MSTIIVQTTVVETSYTVETPINDVVHQISVSNARGPIGPQGPQGDKGDKGDAGPAGLNWRMVWDAGTQYAIDDAVYYSGSSYYAVAVPAVGTAPDPAATTPWMELAIMGQKGDKGDTGATGATGAGVPDTTGATSGEVVRYNGTTTEWHAQTAADVAAVANASGQTLTLWKGTAAQYAAIGTKDASTVYVVAG